MAQVRPPRWHTPDVVRAVAEAKEGFWLPRGRVRQVAGLGLGVASPILAASLVTSEILHRFPSLLFVVAIVAATLVGRLAAGTLALLGSVAMFDYYVIEPSGTFTALNPGIAADLAVFAGLGFVVAAVIAGTDRSRAAAHRARRRADLAQKRLALVSEVSRVLGSSFNLPANLQAACAAIVRDGSWDQALVLTEDDDVLRYLAGAHGDQKGQTPAPGAAITPATAAFRARRLHILDPAQGLRRARLGPLKYRSGLAVPLLCDDGTAGALVLLDVGKARLYTSIDFVFAHEAGQRITRAMENANRYGQQVHIAHTLQQSLLPKSLPQVPGLNVYVKYQAGTGTEVGGDFYDVFSADGETWMAVVGDVCGKGPEAAAVMTITRATLRALALHEQSPQRLLTLLNEALLAQVADLRYVTVSCAAIRLTPEGARVTLALGGHPAPMIRRRDFTVGAAKAGYGMLVGAFPKAVYQESTFDILPGEALVFYTDGIEERETAAPDRAKALLESHNGGPVSEIATVFAKAVQAGPGGKRDDLVVLAFELPDIKQTAG
jgi:GAF domain-containing protein